MSVVDVEVCAVCLTLGLFIFIFPHGHREVSAYSVKIGGNSFAVIARGNNIMERVENSARIRFFFCRNVQQTTKSVQKPVYGKTPNHDMPRCNTLPLGITPFTGTKTLGFLATERRKAGGRLRFQAGERTNASCSLFYVWTARPVKGFAAPIASGGTRVLPPLSGGVGFSGGLLPSFICIPDSAVLWSWPPRKRRMSRRVPQGSWRDVPP